MHLHVRGPKKTLELKFELKFLLIPTYMEIFRRKRASFSPQVPCAQVRVRVRVKLGKGENASTKELCPFCPLAFYRQILTSGKPMSEGEVSMVP